MLCQSGNSFRDVVFVDVQWFGGQGFKGSGFKGSEVQGFSAAAGRERLFKSRKKLMNIKSS